MDIKQHSTNPPVVNSQREVTTLDRRHTCDKGRNHRDMNTVDIWRAPLTPFILFVDSAQVVDPSLTVFQIISTCTDLIADGVS